MEIEPQDPQGPLESWTCEDVQNWFRRGKYAQYSDAFKNCDGMQLASLSKEDFKEIFGDDIEKKTTIFIYNDLQKLKSPPNQGITTSEKALWVKDFVANMSEQLLHDSWMEIKQWQDLDLSNNIGRMIPFVNRTEEVRTLGRILVDMEQWLNVHQLQKCSATHDHYKCSGYSCILAGAASGIGKSTFARQAFLKLSQDAHFLEEHQTLGQMLQRCVSARRLYRLNFQSIPLSDWESVHSETSLCLRILYNFYLYHTGSKESYESFLDDKQGLGYLSLGDVLQSICGIQNQQREMIVLHLDEAQVIEQRRYADYVNNMLQLVYRVNSTSSSYVACVLVITGTDQIQMKKLIRTSGYLYEPINLPPLSLDDMKKIMASFLSKLAQDSIHQAFQMTKFPALDRLVSLCGGNPQLLMFLVGVIGLPSTNPTKMEHIDHPQPKRYWAKEEFDVSAFSRNLADLWYPPSCQTTEATIVQNLVHQIAAGHTLSSVETLTSTNATELRFHILAHAVVQTPLKREDKLTQDFTVGLAESKGLVFVQSILPPNNNTDNRKRQRIDNKYFLVFPPIYYRFPGFDIGDSVRLPGEHSWVRFKILHFAKLERLDATSTEELDIQNLAFRLYWHHHLNPNNISFYLEDVFPLVKFPGKWGQRKLKFPSSWVIHKSLHQVGRNQGWLTLEGSYPSTCFFWGCGNDPFFDSWVKLEEEAINASHFVQSEFINIENDEDETKKITIEEKVTQNVYIVVQSKRRRTKDPFTQQDLDQQKSYLKSMKSSPTLVIIITDGENQATMTAEDQENIIILSQNSFDSFYGPVIGQKLRRDIG